MKYSTRRKVRRINIESGLDASSLVAVKSAQNTIVLMYPDEWDKLCNNLEGLRKLYLSYISREFKVRRNSINLDKEFDKYLGKGPVDVQRYPRGIILQTHDTRVKAAA